MIRNIPRLEGVARNVAFQLLRFDGSGDPDTDLSGTDIPLGARLLRVVRDYDELVTSGTSCERALATMKARTGWYDPELLADLKSVVVEEHAGYTYQLLGARERNGMMVPAGIRTMLGHLLVGKEEVLTPSSLAKILNFASWQEISEPIGVLVPVKDSETDMAE